MKKFLLLIAIFALTFSIAEAQKPVFFVKWAKQISGQGEELPNDIAFDSRNNIYFTCNYNENFILENSYGYSNGSYDYFLAKMNPNGKLIWLKKFGGSGEEIELYVKLNSKDDIILTGEYEETFYLDQSTGLVSNGLHDSFIAKFDQNNILQNHLEFTAKYNVSPFTLESSLDNFYIGGEFGPSMNIGNKITLSGDEDGDPFIIKFDNNQQPIWAESFSCSGLGRIIDQHIQNDEYYFSGFYYGNINFPGKSLNSIDGKSAFFAKLDTSGKFSWATNFTGTDWQAISGITSDISGNIYLSGFYEKEIFINGNKNNSKGNRTAFMIKYDQQGKIIYFYPGISPVYANFSEISNMDNFIINAGGITNSIEFNDFKISKKNFNYSYVGTHDLNGNVLSVNTFFGTSKNIVNKMKTYNNEIFISGKFEGSFCIGQEQFTADDVDTYIAKLGLCGDGSFQYLNYTTAEKRSRFNSEFNFVVDAHLSQNGIKLTDSDSWQHGSVWNKQPVKVDEGFETTFAFRFYDGDNKNSPDGSTPGADGLAFVLQTSGNIAVGHSGGGIGYKGINNAFAIEIDTYANDDKNSVQLNDPNGNHLAVFANAGGILIPDHATNTLLAENINIPEIKIDSTVYYCHIRYDYDEKKLRVYLDTVECYLEPVLVIDDFNLQDHIDLQDGRAYAGITSATGDAQEAHELLEFSFCSKTAPTFLSAKTEEHDAGYTGVSNYPNPFYNSTNFSFSMKQPGKATIEIIDLLGNRIDFIDAGYLDKGSHSINWEASNIPDGIYFYRIIAGNEVTTAKMVKMK